MPIVVVQILLNGLKDILSVADFGKLMLYLCKVSVHACKCLNYMFSGFGHAQDKNFISLYINLLF